MAYVIALSFFSNYTAYFYPASTDNCLVLEKPDGEKGIVRYRHCTDVNLYQYAAAENGGRTMV